MSTLRNVKGEEEASVSTENWVERLTGRIAASKEALQTWSETGEPENWMKSDDNESEQRMAVTPETASLVYESCAAIAQAVRRLMSKEMNAR